MIKMWDSWRYVAGCGVCLVEEFAFRNVSVGGVNCGFGLTRGGSLGLSSGCLLF